MPYRVPLVKLLYSHFWQTRRRQTESAYVRFTIYDLRFANNAQRSCGNLVPDAAYVRGTTRTTAPSSCEAAAHVRFTTYDVRFEC